MSRIEEAKKLYRSRFASFVKFAFHQLHPGMTYHNNWHIEVMANSLTLCAQGKSNRLIINMPPRTLKSLCVSVAYVAWILGKYPQTKILCIHSSKELGMELDEQIQRLMTSPQYMALFPGTRIIPLNKGFKTTRGGFRKFVQTFSDVTGRGADMVIIDDPMRADLASKAGYRQKVTHWFDANVYQRLNNKASAVIITVMQRLHANDFTDHLLKSGDNWNVLSISAIATTNETWDLSHKRVFHRKKGEILNPHMETKENLISALDAMDAYNFTYQYQQGGSCNERNARVVWVPGNKKQRIPCGLYNVPEKDFILYDVFGVDENPFYVPQEDLYTIEEWSEMAVAQQTKLMAEVEL